jgi:hypothetical protein
MCNGLMGFSEQLHTYFLPKTVWLQGPAAS